MDDNEIVDVLDELWDAPAYYVKMMACAYRERFDVPPENMALVTYPREDGGLALFWTTMEELDGEVEGEVAAGAGGYRRRRRHPVWRRTLARWIGGGE